MKVEELRELFCIKIRIELEIFKKKMMKLQPEFIYQNAYKIDCMVSIYEAMLEMSGNLFEETLKMLLVFPNILRVLYNRWLKWNDSSMNELQACLKDNIMNMSREYAGEEAQKIDDIAA